MTHDYAKREAVFVDKLGEERVVRQVRPGRWQVKQPSGQTVSQALSTSVGRFVGQRIRERRQKRGMSLAELAMRAGLVCASKRQAAARMKDIELGDGRSMGIKFGTLYAIAHSLGCSVSCLLPSVEEAFNDAGVSVATSESLAVAGGGA